MKNKLPTIKVQGGQDYVMVKDRVIYFNETYPNGSIVTEIVKNDPDSVLIRATVYPDSKNIERRFVGHSEAFGGAKGVEGQKPVEVCETSAIGRALAAMGIGVLESYASADEIKVAGTFGRTTFRPDTMSAKPISPAQKRLIVNLEGANGQDVLDPEFLTKLDALNSYQASQKINELKGAFKGDSNSKAKAKLDFVEDLEEPPITSYDE